MGKTVRQEKIKLYGNFFEAVRDTVWHEIEIEVEDFVFPETVEHGGNTFRMKWINNRRTYICVG